MSFFRKNRFFLTVTFFFFTVVFFVFWKLRQSYFEGDDWFHFTIFFPLTRDPWGAITAITKPITDSNSLSGGLHAIPVGGEIFFLNVLFFGTNYSLYAMASLSIHALNSVLVYLLAKRLLRATQKNYVSKTKALFHNRGISEIFALLSGIFFALSAVSTSSVTWAAFYGQNMVSVTFLLLCLLMFRFAFDTVKKRYIYLCLFFLLASVLSKETAASLLIILPIAVFFEKRVFSFLYLSRLYVLLVIVYMLFRFGVPAVFEQVTESVPASTVVSQTDTTGTIMSNDLSIYEDIRAELAFRASTFPMKMISEVYFAREAVSAIVTYIAPIIYPIPGNAEDSSRSQNRQTFIHGLGNDVVVYILSILLITVLVFLLRLFYTTKDFAAYKTVVWGILIVTASALPLVMIVLSFPRWGFDTYFDLRHYYTPSVGAALLFPFLLYGLGLLLSRFIHFATRFRINALLVAAVLLLLWFQMNMTLFYQYLQAHVDAGVPRRIIIEQLKKELPVLPKKVVFSIQTDGLHAYGAQLPYQTSFPQIITIVYHDASPFPNSFYEKPLLDSKAEGYQYENGRGLGYYTSKKSLAEAVVAKTFAINDIYAFSYTSKDFRFTQTTEEVRQEMRAYLKKREAFADWNFVEASTGAELITFYTPPGSEITDAPIASTEAKVVRKIDLSHPEFTGSLYLFRITPTLDINEAALVYGKLDEFEPVTQQVTFDRYHSNDVLVSSKVDETQYAAKYNDLLVIWRTPETDRSTLGTFEKIIGSASVTLK